MTKYRLFLLVWMTVTLVAVIPAHAQDIMTTTLSPDANGMGGVDATVISDNALAATANPAQIGIFSLKHVLNAAAYLQDASWVPGSTFSSAALNASAANVGINLRRFVKIPFDISVGAGYSKASMDAGSFNVFQPDGTPLTTPNGERIETRSIGIGMDWYVDFALGYTSKTLDVQQLRREPGGFLAPFDPEVNAYDWGAMLKIPVANIISKVNHHEFMLTPKLRPVLNVTASFAKRNIGESIPSFLYGDTLPLPRQAVAGLDVEIGLTTTVDGQDWQLFSFMLARQAEDLLVSYVSLVQPASYPGFYSSYSYQPGIGELQPIDNLIFGRSNGVVSLGKGWQIEAGEILYLRGGAFYPVGQGSYKTLGGSIRLSGFLKLLAAYNLIDVNYGAIAFLFNHLDLQYDYSEYTGYPTATGTSFQSLNLVVR